MYDVPYTKEVSIPKNFIFRDTAPNSLLKVNRRFGGTCCLHDEGSSVCQARNLHEADSIQSLTRVHCDIYKLLCITVITQSIDKFPASFLLVLFSTEGGGTCLPKHWMTVARLQDVISRKYNSLITTTIIFKNITSYMFPLKVVISMSFPESVI
jgi:hypothetical protein